MSESIREERLVMSTQVGFAMKDAGPIEQDEDGYYYVNLGTIGIPNKSGVIYEMTPAVLDKFKNKNGTMYRKLLRGQLRGECGHPKIQKGMTKTEWIERNLWIEPTLYGLTIRHVDYRMQNNIMECWGWIKPTGAYASTIKDSLDDPHSNTAFSIRVIATERKVNGIKIRTIIIPVTWDFVGGNGVVGASKENWVNSAVRTESDDVYFGEKEVIELREHLVETSDIATEDEKTFLTDMLDALPICKNKLCIYKDW